MLGTIQPYRRWEVNMKWIYLSPHFDDVAFSCGGLVWEQTQSGNDVSILTICAGEPSPGPISRYAQSLHNRWETIRDPVPVRRVENQNSCQILGAKAINFSIPDAIYRRSAINHAYLYTSDGDLFSDFPAEEFHLIEDLKNELDHALPQSCEFVCPLALGGHVDHQLARSAAEALDRPIWYYADFPYLLDLNGTPVVIEENKTYKYFPISERGLQAWKNSIAAHASQISTFWTGEDQMRAVIQAYWEPLQGLAMWHSP
jgi:LmbE family N-acetylglucosaminyl deacetylase